MDESKKWFRKPDWWMLFVTIITLIVFYRQFGEMQTQTGILNAQAKQAATDSIEAARKVEAQLSIAQKQVEAMQKQATAAQDSVKAVQRQMRQDQRAWIVFTPGPVVVEDNSPFLQSFKFVNTGKTPAKRVWIDADIEVVKNTDSPRLRYGHGHIHAITSTGIFYPNSDPMIFTIDRRQINPETGKNDPSLLKHAEWLSLLEGTSYTATYFLLTYYDVFNVKHWQKFCIWNQYSSRQNSVSRGAGEAAREKYFHSGKCSAYNDADNN
jgi:hypothetical protein